jgi:hypothetical protein
MPAVVAKRAASTYQPGVRSLGDGQAARSCPGREVQAMKSNAARREYLEALADFNLACRRFDRAIREIVKPEAAGEAIAIPKPLGPRKPMRRVVGDLRQDKQA